jgi:EAL domain-containing protein (putative c-di-GMP-specific phosphodiesterase class I)
MPQNARERRHDGLIILNYPEFNVCIPVHNRRFWTMSDHITGVFDELLQRQHLQPAFQPIIDLTTMVTVAVEALARWPRLDVTPDVAFQQAKELGRLVELDSACRNAAVDDALEHGLPDRFALFVNLEPSTISAESARQLVARTKGQLTIVAEITERALTTRPAELLDAVRELRDANCAIALDDVGAVPESLALLPFISPSVVKLDISLIQRWPEVEQGAILTAVSAYAERTGARILAEGVETEQHLEQALALGATLGQGWYFARPGPLEDFASPNEPLFKPRLMRTVPRSPFAGVDTSKTRIGKKGLLLAISRHLESQGLYLETPPVVVSAFQSAERFTPDTAKRYSRLAERCPLVAALGVGLGQEPAPGVRGVELSPDDPVRGEWVVAVVGTHYLGALIAKDLGDDESFTDRVRRYSFIVTHDHETVLAAARSLLGRVAPFDVSDLNRP